MEYLEVINAQTNIIAIIESLKFTVDELREKNPERKVFIQGMEKHLRQMNETFLIFKQQSKEFDTLQKMNFNFHKENMELRFEMEKLKEINANLMNGI
jgi:hypothetical protein